MMRPSQNAETAEKRALSCDRQIIDLHWLHCRRITKKIGAWKKPFNNLLINEVFDFNSAQEFASHLGTMEAKFNWINPDEMEAWCLATLQTKNMQNRYYIICHGHYRGRDLVETGYDQALQMIESSVRRDCKRNLKHTEEWALIWKYSKMIGDTPSLLSEFHALATGLETPLDRSTIKSKLGSAEKHLQKVRRSTKASITMVSAS